jgi:predicted small integral membrane protein
MKGGITVKKLAFIPSLLLTSLILAQPAFAQTVSTTGSVTQITSFIQSVVQVLITIAGTVAVGFFVWGGFGYITSTGHPEALDRSKKTVMYSGIGLAIVLGAFVLSGIVSQLATTAFGATH